MKSGIEAWQRSDYAGAVAIWRPLAEKGDADAQFNLGQAYRLGRGVPTNLAAAKTWFERAANQGHMDAETTLGLLLFQNGEQADGIKWLKKAADQGEPRALLVYGTALVNGDGVPQDPALGYAYVSRAAGLGLQPAKETLDQLEQILPAADRKRGATLAANLAKVQAPARPAVAKTPAKEAEAAPVKAPAKESPKKAIAAVPAPKLPPKPQPKRVASSAPPAKPPTKSAAATSAPPVVDGAWRIQLGAFSQKGSAEALYQKLSGKAALAGRHPFYIPVGKITRLQLGPFESKAAAQAACNAVGVACFPVAVK